ncbi:multiple epidermal growth factor-like domains protein 10 [Saccostrea echinata]|uniref:multiple epidermal growth factor-like domains protein 10 n=1 Tax=Saccostrea echinata TaxID=191078 RepID=UPI002A81D5D1|nr:multiple epidermal growth factor-like domains protein 10 [Saccostrea echinata]
MFLECSPGMFGKNCGYSCSGHCAHNESCYHIDGSCKKGCTAGYRGNNCKNVCEPGFYGTNCTQICSFRCLETCNHVDGSCRCTVGWMGPPNCTTECPLNFFGIDCRHLCSDHCSNNDTCSSYDGTCDGGCQEPFIGRICDHQNFTEFQEELVCIHRPLSTAWIAGMAFSLTSNIFAVVIIIFKIRPESTKQGAFVDKVLLEVSDKTSALLVCIYDGVKSEGNDPSKKKEKKKNLSQQYNGSLEMPEKEFRA